MRKSASTMKVVAKKKFVLMENVKKDVSIISIVNPQTNATKTLVTSHVRHTMTVDWNHFIVTSIIKSASQNVNQKVTLRH